MLKAVFRKSLLPIYFIVGAFILDLISFHILDLGVVEEYFGYNIAVVVIIAFLIYIIPNFTAQYLIYTLVLLAQGVLLYVNYSLYTIYGDLFSLEMVHLVEEATQAVTSNFIYFSVILQLVAVYIALVIVGFMILKYCKKEKFNFKHHFSVVSVVILAIVQCFSVGFLYNDISLINATASYEDGDYVFSDAFYLNSASIMKAVSYSKFGTYGYILNLVSNYISEATYDSSTLTEKDLLAIDYFNSGEIYDSSDVFGVDEGNNVIVIMMESLEWFGFGDGTYDYSLNNLSAELTPNIYSLIYGDYTSETDSNGNTTYTNTTEADDSLIATNFYAKSKTNYSEAYGILGNYPTGSQLTDCVSGLDSTSEIFSYAMPNVLSNLGYKTTYVHSNVITFYGRDETHSYLGFDTLVGKDTLTDADGNYYYSGSELEWDHWDCEGAFVENAIDYIVPYEEGDDTPFYTFYLTVSTHGDYTENENEGDCVKYKYYVMYGADDCTYNEATNAYELNKDVTDCTYTTWYQNVLDVYGDPSSSLYNAKLCDQLLYYECGVMGLDEAIGVIVDKLEEYGIEDETTIVLYSDHYAYYNSMSNGVKGLNDVDIGNIELNTIPMIISSPGLKNKNANASAGENTYTIYDGFCSAYDIIPTVFDLLGVEFNENFYLGSSLFSAKDYIYTINGNVYAMEVYYSNTGGLFSQHIYTYDMKTFYLTDTSISEEEYEDLLQAFYNEAQKTVAKVNYLQILNAHNLNSYLA